MFPQSHFSCSLLLFAIISCCVKANALPVKLLVVIVNDDHPHLESYARLTKAYITSQAADVRDDVQLSIIIAQEEWPDVPGIWTYVPLFEELAADYEEEGYNWVLFVQVYTEVSLKNLCRVLKRFDHSKPYFLGRALEDTGRVVIHHYDETGFKYPDAVAGILVTWSAVSRPHGRPRINFSIDVMYELAKSMFDGKEGIPLVDVDEFCPPDQDNTENCATHYDFSSMFCPESSRHPKITDDDIFVMVKTGEVHHKSRVPLQQQLWTGRVTNIEICSEKEDPSIPTVEVDAPNTPRGHCAKFHAILKRAYSQPHINSKKWLVIVDDDTIMNVTRLSKLLPCYSVSDTPIVIGEKYGYRAMTRGYSYATGGAGTILNMQAVKKLIDSGSRCQRPEDPDDMIIGTWLSSLEIPIIHSPLLHQAPPSMYAPRLMKPQQGFAISFHKFSPDNPTMVAKSWLGLDVQPLQSERDEL